MRDLWQAALEALSEEQQKQFHGLERGDVLVSLQSTIEERKAECIRKQWKVSIRGKIIIIRDLFEKLSAWVDTAVEIGDTVIDYAPPQAALPWAATKFILKALKADAETSGKVMAGVEDLANTIVRCAAQERLFLNDQYSISDQLREKITATYASILTYMAAIMKYLKSNTVGRFVKAPFQSFDDLVEDVQSKHEDVASLAAIAQAEKTSEMSASQEKLLQLLADLDAPIKRIESSIQNIQDHLDSVERRKILNAVSTQPYWTYHKAAQKRTPGTCTWLSDKPAFVDWQKSSASSILWLHGIPGSGKTWLTSYVIDELKETKAYFHCRREGGTDRSKCNKILASLVLQLACTPGGKVLHPVIRLYKDNVHGYSEPDDLALTTVECVETLLGLFEYYSVVNIIVDALDEVDQAERMPFLRALEDLQKSSTLIKIFISSRDSYDIVLRLENELNIQSDENAQDIDLFVEDVVSQTDFRIALSADLQAEIITSLKSRAQGMFRLVELQVKVLSMMGNSLDIRDRLYRLPETLKDAYEIIYSEIKQSGQHAYALAKLLFEWLLYNRYERLKLSDVLLLFGIDQSYIIDEVRHVCGVLITIQDDLSFAHLTVREFFESHPEYSASSGHARIATACMQHINVDDADRLFMLHECGERGFPYMLRDNVFSYKRRAASFTIYWRGVRSLYESERVVEYATAQLLDHISEANTALIPDLDLFFAGLCDWPNATFTRSRLADKLLLYIREQHLVEVLEHILLDVCDRQCGNLLVAHGIYAPLNGVLWPDTSRMAAVMLECRPRGLLRHIPMNAIIAFGNNVAIGPVEASWDALVDSLDVMLTPDEYELSRFVVMLATPGDCMYLYGLLHVTSLDQWSLIAITKLVQLLLQNGHRLPEQSSEPDPSILQTIQTSERRKTIHGACMVVMESNLSDVQPDLPRRQSI